LIHRLNKFICVNILSNEFANVFFKGDILRAVSEGADLFDTSYPSEMANNGHAFTFKFATDSNASDMTLSMNLWDKSFARDFQPFVPSCECHACQNYTRAYTHHLLIAHEMLANVLLIRSVTEQQVDFL